MMLDGWPRGFTTMAWWEVSGRISLMNIQSAMSDIKQPNSSVSFVRFWGFPRPPRRRCCLSVVYQLASYEVDTAESCNPLLPDLLIRLLSHAAEHVGLHQACIGSSRE